MRPVVQLEGLTKRYGAAVAVDRLSLMVEPGQCLSLLGPSGCGKTTTLRMIAGFEQPDAGEILIEGVSMRGRRPYERNIGLVFQDYMLFRHMTVRRNIEYGMLRRGVKRPERDQRLEECLALVKLRGYDARMPRQLSGGEQQRVAIARALVTRPPLMLLDEPLSNLDAKLRTEVRAEIKEILARAGTTTIIVTHDQEEAMSMADTIVVMRSGRVMQQGTPYEIYDRPANRFTAGFIGRMNWFPGEVGPSGMVPLAPGAAVSGQAMPAGARVDVGLRPERLTLQPGPGDVLLRGTVRDVENLGPDLHVHETLDGGAPLLSVTKNAGGRPIAGQAVTLGFAPGSCVVLPAEPG